MDTDNVLANLEKTLLGLPCKGPTSPNLCFQANCDKCQAIQQIRAAQAKNPSPKAKILLQKLKTRFTGILSWLNFKRRSTTDDIIKELKRLGVYNAK